MEYSAPKNLLKSALALRDPLCKEFSSATPLAISLASRRSAEIYEKKSRSTLPFSNTTPPDNFKNNEPQVHSSIAAELEEAKEQLSQTEKAKQLYQNKTVELQLQVEALKEENVSLTKELNAQADILRNKDNENLEENTPKSTLLRKSSIEELSFSGNCPVPVLSASNSCHSLPSQEVSASLAHYHALISELSQKQDEVSAFDAEFKKLHQCVVDDRPLEEEELEKVQKIKTLLHEKDKVRERLEEVVELEGDTTELHSNKPDQKYDELLFRYAELVEKYADIQKKRNSLVETNHSLIDESRRFTVQTKEKETALQVALDNSEQSQEKLKTQLLAIEIRERELEADLTNSTIERKHAVEEYQKSQTLVEAAREELATNLESALRETACVRKEVEVKAIQLQESEFARQELEKENELKENAVKLEKERAKKLREKVLEVESLCVTASSVVAAPLWESLLLSSCGWDYTATTQSSPIRELIARVSRQLAATQSTEWCAAVFHSFQLDEGYFTGDIGNEEMRPSSDGCLDGSVGSNVVISAETSERACREMEDLKVSTNLRVECGRKEKMTSFQERVWSRMQSIPLQEVWEIAAAFLNKEDIRPNAIWNSFCERTVKEKSTSQLQYLIQQESTARRAIERKLIEETLELVSQDCGVSVDLMRNQVFDLLEQLVSSSTECRDSLEKLEEFMVLVDDARNGEKKARERLQRRDEELTEVQKHSDQEKQQLRSLVKKGTKILREQYLSRVNALEERNIVLSSQLEEIPVLRISEAQCKDDIRKLNEAMDTMKEELEDKKNECSEMLLKMEECMRLTDEARESERNMLNAMREEQKKNLAIMADVDKERQKNQLFEAKVCDKEKRLEACFYVLDEFILSGTTFLEKNLHRERHSLSVRSADTEGLSDCTTEIGPRFSSEMRDSVEAGSDHNPSISPPRECSPSASCIPVFSGSTVGNEKMVSASNSVSQERYSFDPDRLRSFLVHFLDRQDLQEKDHEIKEEHLKAKCDQYSHQLSQAQATLTHLQELLEEKSQRMDLLLEMQQSMQADIDLLCRLDEESESREQSMEFN